MRAALVLSFVAVVAVLGLLGAQDAAAATPTDAFEEAPCSSMAQGVENVDASRLLCGFVPVEESRGDSDSRTLRLAVLVLKATSATPQPDPIVFLTGGPGQAAVNEALIGWGDPYFSGAMQEDRDIVFYDQRGTGQSGALDCAEYDRVQVDALKESLTGSETAARYEQALTTCRDRYLADGVDLDAYDSAESAQDIVEVMTALGYDEWNLYGVSYGTHLAIVALRDTEGVRSVVLDSTSPPQVNSGIERARTFENTLGELFEACNTDAGCAAAYPGLEDEYWNLIARANADPIEVQIDDADGSKIDVSIDGDAIVNGTFQAMYDPALVALLPLAIHDIAIGNTGILTLLAQQLTFQTFGISSGMFLSVLCNEEIPFYTEQLLAEANEGVRPELVAVGIDASNAEAMASQQRLCEILDLPQPPAIENRAVESDVPALVLAGRFDPTTPTEYSRLAASTLPNSYYFEFPSLAHSVNFYEPECAGPLAAAFLANPGQAPDGSCVDDNPNVAWALPEPEPTPAPQPSPTAPGGVIVAPDTGHGAERHGGRAGPVEALALATAGVALALAGWSRRRKA